MTSSPRRRSDRTLHRSRQLRLLVACTAAVLDAAIIWLAFASGLAAGLAAAAAVLAVLIVAIVRRFRLRTHPPPDDYGLNEHVYRTLIAMAVAARARNATAYFAHALELKGDGQTALIYAQLLLGQTVVSRLGVARPTPDQLCQLIDECSPNLSIIGRFTDHAAELTLRDVFDNSPSPIEGAPTGSDFLLYAGVLLGELSNDPGQDLALLRPFVARMCAQFADEKPDTLAFLRPSPNQTT